MKSISDLCKKNRLTVSNVKEINSQGGSIRCEIINEETNVKSKIKKFINYEFKNRLFNTKYLRSFKYRILSHNKAMYNFLYKLKNRNNKISVYGASGKGQALMQFCNINYKLIDKVYDKSNLKKGRFTPGTNIKINLSKHINRKNIDYMLLLSWNLKSEIINQEKVFLKKGGKFIIPFPKPRILKI